MLRRKEMPRLGSGLTVFLKAFIVSTWSFMSVPRTKSTTHSLMASRFYTYEGRGGAVWGKKGGGDVWGGLNA